MIFKKSPLPRSFYQRDTIQVAQDLLGKILIRMRDNQLLAGIIAETEAYAGKQDPASHAFSKKSNRNAALFGPAGHAYVYFIYGNHYCLDIVAKEPEQEAGGVLIRSIIPIHGIEIMQRLRNKDSLRDLTNGPGKLGQALQITRSHNLHDMTIQGELYISDGINLEPANIQQTPRIGISKAQDKLWRFVIKDAESFAIENKLI